MSLRKSVEETILELGEKGEAENNTDTEGVKRDSVPLFNIIPPSPEQGEGG